jgi:glycosyltransferase involved in cell wall biosynthesis
MNGRTFAKTFEHCAKALQDSRFDDAERILQDIDHAALAPHALKLYNHLRTWKDRISPLRVRSSHPTGTADTTNLSELDVGAPVAGVSIVSACMNRESNLLKVLPSWLDSPADEIIIVDWSSTDPLWPRIAHIPDPRLKVVRIEDETRWVLTHAFNVGLRLARHEIVFKLDADISIAKDFFKLNPVVPGAFVRGFWKQALDAGKADQVYTNGSFGCRKTDLRSVGYYDERIVTYGWDDSDLYRRLHSLGLAGNLLAFDSLSHLNQAETQRLENQDVTKTHFLSRFPPTELENIINKFDSSLNGDWGAYFPRLDFVLETGDGRAMNGYRIPRPPVQMFVPRRVAEVLAISELAAAAHDLFPGIPWPTLKSTEFARLLRDARHQGCEAELLRALRQKTRIQIFRSSEEKLAHPLRQTLETVRKQHPSLNDCIFIIEDAGFQTEGDAGARGSNLRASGTLLDALQEVLAAAPRTDFEELETTLRHDPDSCTAWKISFSGLAKSARAKADRVVRALGAGFEPSIQPAPATALVASVYDEPNLLRVIEYAASLILNLRAFEHVLLCYEPRDGTFQRLLHQLQEQTDIAPQRLTVSSLSHRPTIEQLFAFQSLLPAGTLLAISNADVVFDASLHRLAGASEDGIFYCLSRWDVDIDTGFSHPIRLENGTPNHFSADAWVARTPFAPDFHLDYRIGTLHCDSFINNQLGRSERYKAVNPCLDVRVFHLHDSRFNSWQTKRAEQKREIDRDWEEECLRTGDSAPFKGVPWTYLAHGSLLADPEFLVKWRPRALVLDCPQFTLASLLWLRLAASALGGLSDVCIVLRLSPDAGAGSLGRLLAEFKRYFQLPALIFDIAGAKADITEVCFERTSHDAPFLDALSRGGMTLLAQQLQDFADFPQDATISQLRAEIQLAQDTGRHLALFRLIAQHAPAILEDIRGFVNAVRPWSEENQLLRPFESDLFRLPPVAPALHIAQPRVSFVTSLFRGDEFLPGYLENVAHAAIEARGEVVLVDANCNDHDTAAIDLFFRQWPQLRKLFNIVTLDSDPGLYACWQLAIKQARGEFITNANIDDRRSPSHTRRLANLLEERPEIAGASGSISAVTEKAEGGWFEVVKNQVWFQHMETRDFGYQDLFVANPDGSVRSQNIMHCMPVWRRALHKKYGFFNEADFGTSADWAFWLLCGRAGERFHLDTDAFGRYFLNPGSHNRRNDADGAKERRIIAELIGVQQDTLIKQ